ERLHLVVLLLEGELRAGVALGVVLVRDVGLAVALGEVDELLGRAGDADDAVGDRLLGGVGDDERLLAVLEVHAAQRRDLHLLDQRGLLVRVDEPGLHVARGGVLVALEQALELRVLPAPDEAEGQTEEAEEAEERARPAHRYLQRTDSTERSVRKRPISRRVAK